MSPEMIAKLSTLLTQAEKKYEALGGVSAAQLCPDSQLCPEPLLNELIFSMLMWEASIEHTLKAVERISSELVDLNELRVCTADELSSILGSRMPRSLERADRLILVLNTIYDRHNSLSLASLNDLSKKEVQDYLSSIDGLPSYAGARVVLLGLGWHAFPLDERLARLLGSQGIISAGSDLTNQSQQLERGVRASDALRTYTLIEHWSQKQRASSRSAGSDRSRKTKKSKKGATS